MTDGRSSAIEWRSAGPAEEFDDVYHALVLRFGLYRDMERSHPLITEIWHSPGQPVELFVHRNSDDTRFIGLHAVGDW